MVANGMVEVQSIPASARVDFLDASHLQGGMLAMRRFPVRWSQFSQPRYVDLAGIEATMRQ
jgi:hypothetical protein